MNSHRALSFAFSLCLAACVDGTGAPSTDGDGVDQATGIAEDDAALLAGPPRIDPPTAVEHIGPNGTYSCDVGNFCAVVKDATGWTVFKMFNCRTYDLSNWNGGGFYFNNQTGAGTTTLFYDQAFHVIRKIVRGTGAPTQVPIDWTPVWHIKNC